MPAIVKFPKVVQDAVRDFGDLFSCEPQRRHFAEYLTGLMIAQNKTVTGINGEFAETTDQSLEIGVQNGRAEQFGIGEQAFFGLSGDRRVSFVGGTSTSYQIAYLPGSRKAIRWYRWTFLGPARILRC